MEDTCHKDLRWFILVMSHNVPESSFVDEDHRPVVMGGLIWHDLNLSLCRRRLVWSLMYYFFSHFVSCCLYLYNTFYFSWDILVLRHSLSVIIIKKREISFFWLRLFTTFSPTYQSLRAYSVIKSGLTGLEGIKSSRIQIWIKHDLILSNPPQSRSNQTSLMESLVFRD